MQTMTHVYSKSSESTKTMHHIADNKIRFSALLD